MNIGSSNHWRKIGNGFTLSHSQTLVQWYLLLLSSIGELNTVTLLSVCKKSCVKTFNTIVSVSVSLCFRYPSQHADCSEQSFSNPSQAAGEQHPSRQEQEPDSEQDQVA